MKKERVSALINVDIQDDFLPKGSLPVPNGDKVVSVANEMIALFKKAKRKIVLTRDWHPQEHVNFEANGRGGIWPYHCVQGTPGAEFAKGLNVTPDMIVFSKGENPDVECYGAFRDEAQKPTGFKEILESYGITDLYIMGLATDYCVKNTAIGAIENGFNVTLIKDGCRGVAEETTIKAIEEMKAAGVKISNSKAVKATFEMGQNLAKVLVDAVRKKQTPTQQR